MTHTRGRLYHPMIQGKIECSHRSLKNQILLENYYLPGQLEARLAEFVDYYNSRRYHESLNNSPRPMSTSVVVKPSSHGGKTSNSKPSSYDAGCTTSLQLQLQLRWTRSSLNSIANLSKRF
jgi:hypothetical protein